jgi:chemotaxis protein MotB
MARKKKEQDIPLGSPAWMATFSDMITQILAFFILLFSFSSINERKFTQVIASLQGSFGVMPGNTHAIPLPNPSPGSGSTSDPTARTDPSTQPTQSLTSIERQLQSALIQQDADQHVRVQTGDNQILIHFDAALLFDSGRAEIKQLAIPALDAIATVLNNVGNNVVIEGHTDSDPMTPNPQFPDNWALSGGRAANVLRYFIDFHGVSPERLSFAGYSDIRPVATNATPEGKAKNRRVDIIIQGR